MEAKNAMDGDLKKKREAQAEPTFFECPANRKSSDGRNAKGSQNGLPGCETIDLKHDEAAMHRHISGQGTRRRAARPFGRNPRDWPGSRDLGRNLSRDEPKPSPARDSDQGEVGAGGNAGPHCIWDSLRRT